MDLTLSQPLISGFINEVVDWSSYQFILNIMMLFLMLGGMLFLMLGGICLDFPTKKPAKVDETDWKTMSDYDYTN